MMFCNSCTFTLHVPTRRTALQVERLRIFFPMLSWNFSLT